MRVRPTRQYQPRASQAVVRHADVAQAERPAKPRTEGLGGGLLGGKALGQEMFRARAGLELAIFGGIEDAARVPRPALFLTRRLNLSRRETQAVSPGWFRAH